MIVANPPNAQSHGAQTQPQPVGISHLSTKQRRDAYFDAHGWPHGDEYFIIDELTRHWDRQPALQRAFPRPRQDLQNDEVEAECKRLIEQYKQFHFEEEEKGKSAWGFIQNLKYLKRYLRTRIRQSPLA